MFRKSASPNAEESDMTVTAQQDGALVMERKRHTYVVNGVPLVQAAVRENVGTERLTSNSWWGRLCLSDRSDRVYAVFVRRDQVDGPTKQVVQPR